MLRPQRKHRNKRPGIRITQAESNATTGSDFGDPRIADYSQTRRLGRSLLWQAKVLVGQYSKEAAFVGHCDVQRVEVK